MFLKKPCSTHSKGNLLGSYLNKILTENWKQESLDSKNIKIMGQIIKTDTIINKAIVWNPFIYLFVCKFINKNE